MPVGKRARGAQGMARADACCPGAGLVATAVAPWGGSGLPWGLGRLRGLGQLRPASGDWCPGACQCRSPAAGQGFGGGRALCSGGAWPAASGRQPPSAVSVPFLGDRDGVSLLSLGLPVWVRHG